MEGALQTSEKILKNISNIIMDIIDSEETLFIRL